jgi:cysteine desulfurase
MIYLDHNATTFTHPQVLEKIQPLFAKQLGNASSVHQLGREAKGIIESARFQVAQTLTVSPRNLVFCSSATEAIHLGICGFLAPGDRVLVTQAEHPAIWGALAQAQAKIDILPLDQYGRISIDQLKASIQPDTKLVIMMAVQNEIGNIYPIEQISKAIHPIPLFCDGVQALGKIPFAPEKLGCAMSVFSGHKIGGLIGCGVLWTKPGLILKSYISGGAQERGRRAGTENTIAITAFAQACSLIPQRLIQMQDVAFKRDYLQKTLLDRFPDLCIHGDVENRVPNTLALRLDGLDGELVLQALDLKGICISSGSACSSGALEPSKILLALGLSAKQAKCGLRISLGVQTTQEEIDIFIETLIQIAQKLRLN